jgi:hypothetical protein
MINRSPGDIMDSKPSYSNCYGCKYPLIIKHIEIYLLKKIQYGPTDAVVGKIEYTNDCINRNLLCGTSGLCNLEYL